MKKKVIALCLSLAMIASFTACGAKPAEEPAAAASSAAEEVAEEEAEAEEEAPAEAEEEVVEEEEEIAEKGESKAEPVHDNIEAQKAKPVNIYTALGRNPDGTRKL